MSGRSNQTIVRKLHIQKRDWKIEAILDFPEKSLRKQFQSSLVLRRHVLLHFHKSQSVINDTVCVWRTLFLSLSFTLLRVHRSKPMQVFHSCQNHIFNGFETQSGWPHSWGLMHYGTFRSEGVFNNFCLRGLILIYVSCCWLGCIPALIRTT